jgi:hypothetical protein
MGVLVEHVYDVWQISRQLASLVLCTAISGASVAVGARIEGVLEIGIGFLARHPPVKLEKTSSHRVAGKFPPVKDLVVVLTTHNTLVFSTS